MWEAESADLNCSWTADLSPLSYLLLVLSEENYTVCSQRFECIPVASYGHDRRSCWYAGAQLAGRWRMPAELRGQQLHLGHSLHLRGPKPWQQTAGLGNQTLTPFSIFLLRKGRIHSTRLRHLQANLFLHRATWFLRDAIIFLSDIWGMDGLQYHRPFCEFPAFPAAILL